MKSHIVRSDHKSKTQKLLYILFQHKKHCAMILAWFSIIPLPKLFFAKYILSKNLSSEETCVPVPYGETKLVKHFHLGHIILCFIVVAITVLLCHSPNISFLEKRDCIFSVYSFDGSSITEQSSHERQNPFWFYLQFCCTQRGFLQN